VVVTTLAGVDPTAAGMRTIVLVGTADTTVLGGRVVTRRHHPWPEPAR
jgi:precorrin-3B methylase